MLITNSKFIILNSYLAFARTIIRKRIFKITTMGLFDFLFGSDESSTNGLFDIEDYRSISEDRRYRWLSCSAGSPKRSWRYGVHFAMPSARFSSPLHLTLYTLHSSSAAPSKLKMAKNRHFLAFVQKNPYLCTRN